jgi:hypothetical protein
MKLSLLLILALLLLIDLAEDGFLGKVNFYVPNTSAKTSIPSSPQPDSGKTDFQHELASADLPGSTLYGDAQPVTFRLPPTLQIIHYYHLSSSGGIPL